MGCLMKKKLRLFVFIIITFAFTVSCENRKDSLVVLQPKSNKVELLKFNEFQIKSRVLYVPATTETVKWGYLPNLNDLPVAKLQSGSYLVVDLTQY